LEPSGYLIRDIKQEKYSENYSRSYVLQCFSAVFLAISLRRLADTPSARAFPPLRPRATAAGVSPVIRERFLDLSRGDAHGMDGGLIHRKISN
jgi:hypothetical protein